MKTSRSSSRQPYPAPQNWNTSITMLNVLRTGNSDARKQRIASLMRVLRETWIAVASRELEKYSIDRSYAEDIVSAECEKMLTKPDYFTKYDPSRLPLHAWIRTKIKYAAKKHCSAAKITAPVEDDFIGGTESDPIAETSIIFSIIKEAFRSLDALAGSANLTLELEMFRAIKMASSRIPPKDRREKGWTEYQERTAIPKIWELLKNVAIPAAADLVSASPEDAAELAKSVVEHLQFTKNQVPFSDPEQLTIR